MEQWKKHPWKILDKVFNREITPGQAQLLLAQLKTNGWTADQIHYDLAIKATKLMKQNGSMTTKEFRKLPKVKKIFNAMDVIKENYL